MRWEPGSTWSAKRESSSPTSAEDHGAVRPLLRGMVLNRLLKIGGEDFDNAITALVRRNQEFLIGRATAERLRREFGIFHESTDSTLTVYGRDLVTGVPSRTEVSISLVRAAVKDLLEECLRAIKSMIDRTPPDVRRVILDQGICLTGRHGEPEGTCSLHTGEHGASVRTIEQPELCAVRGLRKIISDKSYYKRLTYSMLGEDYRWLR